MKQKPQKSKQDRIEEFISKGRYVEAIPMLQALIRNSPTDSRRRKLAFCQFEAGKFTDYFSTLQVMEVLTDEDLVRRQRAMDRLVGQRASVSVDKVECLARLADELIGCGTLKEAAHMLVEGVNTWLALYRLEQARSEDFPAFSALIFEPALGGVDIAEIDALVRAKISFCRAWFLRLDDTRPPERFDQALGLLRLAEPAWDGPEIHWEMAQIHQARRSWAALVAAYYRYLEMTQATAAAWRLGASEAGSADLSGDEAEQIRQAAGDLITRSAELGEEAAPALIPVLEYCGMRLDKSPFRGMFYALMDTLPDWALQGRSPLLARLWVARRLEDGRHSLNELEGYIKAQQEHWPEQHALVFLLAKLYYAQGEPSLAMVQINRAIKMAPENADYECFHQMVARIERISLRRPADRYDCLNEAEQHILGMLFGVGKFEDLSIFAAACKLPVQSAAETLDHFAAMKLLSPAPLEAAEDRLPPGFVTVGDEVYRLQEDITYQLERQRESKLFFPVRPRESDASASFITSVFKSRDEKLVYRALSRIYYMKEYQNEFLICVNVPMTAMFDQSLVKTLLTYEDLNYFYATSVDFCVAKKACGTPLLAVEVDGISHYESARRINDRQKNMIFQKAGLPLLRICQPNQDVFYLAHEISDALEECGLLPEQIFRSPTESEESCPE